MTTAQKNARHGTYSRYTTGKCRCPLCCRASSRYNKRRMALIERGEWKPWAEAEPVRQHIVSLRHAGLSVDSIAALAGVSACNVSLLLRDDKSRVRACFAERLLAVQVSLDDLEAWVKVDSTGTVRRLQALMFMGWSATYLAERIGMDRASIRRVMDRRTVRVFTAVAVKTVFEELSVCPPPTCSRYLRMSVTRVQRYAQGRGWVSAMAWDDIDDPNESPRGVRVDLGEAS